MNILQRNLNRSTFVVWEMKRNVSVVRLIVGTRTSGPPASQPASCPMRLSADLSVIWLRVPTQYGCCSWVLVQCVSSHRIVGKCIGVLRWRECLLFALIGKQGLSKIWRAGFNSVWTQMVATSSTCYDVVTFLTQRTYSCSNFFAISSLVLKMLIFWYRSFTFKF